MSSDIESLQSIGGNDTTAGSIGSIGGGDSVVGDADESFISTTPVELKILMVMIQSLSP